MTHSGQGGAAIHVDGVVQGVGFRPFIYGLAERYALTGWVRNTAAGVDIRIDGDPDHLKSFVEAITSEAPPLARIEAVTVTSCSPDGFTTFEIVHSESKPGDFLPVSADVSICADCLREMHDPTDRRYRYPFINCTNCGPRFTIIKEVPYDRPLTTMSGFEMCPDCAAEYLDPHDRRFHAQPVACPECGPQVWLCTPDGEVLARRDEAVRAVVHALHEGQIVAIKGLGGFHLACDARSDAAITTLRERKQRPAKPFALMVADLDMVARYTEVDEDERDLLTGQAHPIVLLNKREHTDLSDAVAPGQVTLGLMLPYTPLHVLLFDEDPIPLVMTSGNLSEEPIVTDNGDALARLGGIADLFLLHDRPIETACDDSVMRVHAGEELPVRRSRGYAPYPVPMPLNGPPLLAVGGELKNTFCLVRDGRAFMSQHIGDMANYETYQAFERSAAHYERLFRTVPDLLACDSHPGYLSSRYARERAERDSLPLIEVQHHHAHIASVLAEQKHPGDRPVIGLAFDGTGYGPDSTIWGGEFLVADYAGFERVGWLKPMPLPGGDAATRRPARIAWAYLLANGIEPGDDLPICTELDSTERSVIRTQLERGLNVPMTSSMGRLFDAAAALTGMGMTAYYEGQAAIEFEATIDGPADHPYPFPWDGPILDPAPALAAIIDDLHAGVAVGQIAARFHAGLAEAAMIFIEARRQATGLNEVALSGGTFQNVTLLTALIPRLHQLGYTVYTHRLLPPNDGGLALGQAVIARAQVG